MNAFANNLQGLTVMVTRPQDLAEKLARQIEGKGGKPLLYPVIRIEDPDDTGSRDQLLQKLSSFDIAIFISPTAVMKTFTLIESLPPAIQLAAIGSSTEKALQKLGLHVSITAQGHDSESLLQNAQLQPDQLTQKSVLIFRGQGGRELLGNTLVSRGASVSYAELYKRVRNDQLTALTTRQLDTIDVITVTSNESLQNLYDLVEHRNRLLDIPLLVPGSRCRALAEQLGFSSVIQAENATDSACLAALLSWRHRR